MKAHIALLLLLTLVACAPKDDTLVIGAIMPLSGDAAQFGIDQQKIAAIAIDEVNAHGGINGKTLAIAYEDGKCEGKSALTAATKLINTDGVKVIFGGLCSGETLGAAPLAEEKQVIMFSSVSSSPAITDAGDYIFRNYPSDAASGAVTAQAATQRGHDHMCVLTEQTDYALGVLSAFKDAYRGTIALEETFAQDATDMRTQLTKLREARCDAILLIPQTPKTLVRITHQMKELGVDMQIYANEFATSEETLADPAAMDVLDGALFPLVALNESSPAFASLEREVIARHGTFPTSLPKAYSASTYDAVHILADGLRRCGEDTACLKEYLYGIRNREGAAGTISIDRNGDVEFPFALSTLRDGKVTAA